jgi:hypothetical protein
MILLHTGHTSLTGIIINLIVSIDPDGIADSVEFVRPIDYLPGSAIPDQIGPLDPWDTIGVHAIP